VQFSAEVEVNKMKRSIVVLVLMVFLIGAFNQKTDAARWTFHFEFSDCPGGNLTVWGTINCIKVEPPIFEGYAKKCHVYKGLMPGPPINDLIYEFHWDWWCGNVDIFKIALPGWHDPLGIWQLGDIPSWIDANVEDYVTIPTLGDSTGTVQYIYTMVDPSEWMANPQPLQDSYEIVDGVCPALPGFLIGTTPMVFDSLAPEGGNPFQTTPFTGTVFRDGEFILDPSDSIPTLTEWGLIIFGVMLALWMGWMIVRRRQKVRVGI
jgi:hypothetical protein